MLERARVVFYGPSRLRGPGAAIPHRFGLVKDEQTNPARASEVLRQMAGSARRVVLSEENFLGGLYSGEGARGLPLYGLAHARVGRLAAALAGHPVSVFVAVREPASFLVSAYSQNMMSGTYLPFSRFVRSIDPAQIRWSDLIGRLSAVEGIEHVYVWRYEDYAKVIAKVLRRMVAWRIGPMVEPLGRVAHMGLSARAIAHVLEQMEGTPSPSLGRQARELFPISETEPRFAPWRDDALAGSRAAYDADLERLRTMDRVTFIQPNSR